MITSMELGWAVGFLEGEGYFTRDKKWGTVMVGASQVQREPLERLQAYFGGSIYYSQAPSHKNPIHIWRLGGPKAVGLVMTIWTLMSPRRKAQIKAVLDGWRTTPYRHQNKTGLTRRLICRNGHPWIDENIYRYGKVKIRTVCKPCHASQYSRRRDRIKSHE